MLFTKLLRRGAPGYIVRLLMFWYAHQTMCVRWGSSVSSKFTVSNGVRQGGILSPFLFNIYMDDLSVNLKKCPTGCIAGGTIVNNLMYADDIVLLSRQRLVFPCFYMYVENMDWSMISDLILRRVPY